MGADKKTENLTEAILGFSHEAGYPVGAADAAGRS